VSHKLERNNVRDHRDGTSDHPFQEHAQVRLMVILRRVLLSAAGAGITGTHKRPEPLSRTPMPLRTGSTGYAQITRIASSPASLKRLKEHSSRRSDSSTVELSLWECSERSTAVALYKVIGGGRGIPGRPQGMERIAGKYNQDIDAWAKIWSSFKRIVVIRKSCKQKSSSVKRFATCYIPGHES